MAIFNWSQAITAGGPAIQNWSTRRITLHGSYEINTSNKTATIIVKQIEVYYSGGTNQGNFYLDGKILINGAEAYVSSSTPAQDNMAISGTGTYTLNIDAQSIIANFKDNKPPEFTVQMTKNNYSEFYWVNGLYELSQWTAKADIHTVKAVSTISYNANGGSGTMAPTYIAYGSSYKVVTNTFSAPAGTSTTYTITLNPNYTGSTNTTKTVTNVLPKVFNTWRRGSTSGTALTPGTSITVTDDIVLYATWKDGTLQKGTISLGSLIRNDTTATGYTVSFNTQGGSSVNSLTSIRTTKYTFQGWMSSASGTSVEYDATSLYSFTENVVLYAKWGSTIVNGSINLPAASTKTGYKFLGWGASAQATSYKQPGELITPDKNTTYYAIWKAAGMVRLYTDSTNKFKTALVYMYLPDGDNDTSPWKIVIPYIKTDTNWKVISG